MKSKWFATTFVCLIGLVSLVSLMLLGQWVYANGPQWLLIEGKPDDYKAIGAGTFFAMLVAAGGIVGLTMYTVIWIHDEK